MNGLRPVWAVKAIVLIIITSIFFRCVWATNHSVGGASGWGLRSNLRAWSSRTTFHVGDFLVFRYMPLHDVLEVNQIDYIMCRTRNPIKAYTDGESVIRLRQPGIRYFICGRLRHCFMGLKLQVRVEESDNNHSTDGGGGSNHTHSSPPSDHTPPPPPPPPPTSPSTRTPVEPPPPPDIAGESPHPCCSSVGDIAGNLLKWWLPISTTLVILWTQVCLWQTIANCV